MKNVIYQHRWKAENGWRYELRFIPSDTTPLSSPVIKNFPPNAFLNQDFTSKIAFDTLPIGLYATPELTFNIKYSALPDELKTWLVEYATETDSIPPLVLPPSTGGLTGLLAQIILILLYAVRVTVEKLGPKVPLSNYWILSTDFGNTTLDFESFTRTFEGVQKRVPHQSFQAKKAKQGVDLTMDVTIVHALRAITESLNVAALVALTLLLPSALNTASTSTLYDAVVKDGNGMQWFRQFVNGHVFKLVPLQSFLVYVQEELQKWYRKLTRDEAASFAFDLAVPHTFYAEGDAVANTPTDVVPFSAIHFLAQVRRNNDVEIIGGLLSNDKDHGWGNGDIFANMWDWLHDFGENFYLKLVLLPNAQQCRTNTMTLRFGGVLQNITPTHESIALTNFIDYEFTIVQSGNTLRAAKSDEVRMPSESDKTSTIHAQTGSQSEIDFACHFFLHNLPTASAETSDEAGSFLQADGFNVNALYHANSLVPGGFTRIHEAVRINDGLTDYPVASSDYVEKPNGLEGSANDAFLWTGYAAQTQERSGLPNAVCKAMQERFGHRYMSLVKGRIKLREDLNELYIGDRFPFDASIEAAFAPFGTSAILLSCEQNYETGIADIELITIPT